MWNRRRLAFLCIAGLMLLLWLRITQLLVEPVQTHPQGAGFGRYELTHGKRMMAECTFGVPCEYPDEMDLRIIVMVYDRPASLLKCLESLWDLELDGDRASVEIWVDRGTDISANNGTIETAKNFTWTKGYVSVYVQSAHAGICGQWIDTWRPRENSKELAIFLEDDVDLSPYAYRWLKAAAKHYRKDSDVAGYSLFEGSLVDMENPVDLVFKHSRLGTQGFAPNPRYWRQFQDWYHQKKLNASYHPYVNNDPKITGWYKQFEKTHKETSMWSIWFIKFCDENNLWTVYPNMAAHAKANQLTSVNGAYFAYHRQEKGLHFAGRGRSAKGNLISTWHNYFIDFPHNTNMYFYNGKKVVNSTVIN